MGLVDGKVALITGGPRGQGLAHAVTLTREGADIVIFDTCEDVPEAHTSQATIPDLDALLFRVSDVARCVTGVAFPVDAGAVTK